MTYPFELNKVIKERLQDIELALNKSSIVAITDTRGNIQFANDKFCELSKYSKDELIGSNQSIVNSGYHSREFFKEMWRTIGRGQVWQGEIRNQAKDGSYYWVDTTIVPFLKENNKPYQYIAIRHDITKLKEYEAAIEQMAYYDALTFLPNRHYLKEWIGGLKKDKEETITVLFIDVDRFKTVNDSYGHRVGDDVLKEVAKRIASCICPSKHLMIRQGGDEFIVFLKGINSSEKIIEKVNEIIEQFSEPFMINGQASQITISIGISMTKRIGWDEDQIHKLEKLIIQADTAMYHAKRRTGNSYCFNTNDQNEQHSRYCLIERELRKALENDEFFLHYQPIMNLKTKELIGLEALLRWKNKRLGDVSPAEFIPIMEEIGLIIDVGKWIFTVVLRQMKQWKKQGIIIPKIAVNLSPLQLKDPYFIHYLKRLLKEENVNPELLELEITEGTILHLQEAEMILKEVRKNGIRISIDDFGTGYSSLSLLKNLPVNTLKIDKSFIHDLDKNGKVIVDTIISMGKNLNFNIVAEGIETKEQLSYLQNSDCLEGQGYYFSKPLPAEQIKKFYLEHSQVVTDLYSTS